MRTPVVQPRALAGLLTDLTAAGVSLPAEIANAATVLEAAASGELVRQASALPGTLALLNAERGDLLEHIRQRAVLALVTDTLAESTSHVALELAEATAAVLREGADDLIDQLRPRFDEAAKVFHDATRAGLFFRITAEQVIALDSPRAVTAWQSLPAHATVLDEIASVRNGMTDVLGIAPDPDPFGPRQYGLAFGTGWTTDSGVNRWLRLSSGMPGPLTLLTVEETRRLANATRATPRPVVTPERDGKDARLVGSTAGTRA